MKLEELYEAIYDECGYPAEALPVIQSAQWFVDAEQQPIIFRRGQACTLSSIPNIIVAIFGSPDEGYVLYVLPTDESKGRPMRFSLSCERPMFTAETFGSIEAFIAEVADEFESVAEDTAFTQEPEEEGDKPLPNGEAPAPTA